MRFNVDLDEDDLDRILAAEHNSPGSMPPWLVLLIRVVRPERVKTFNHIKWKVLNAVAGREAVRSFTFDREKKPRYPGDQ